MLHTVGRTLFAWLVCIIAIAPRASAHSRPATGASVEVALAQQARYLIVRDPSATQPVYHYARRSHFTYTADGHFATREGMLLQGYGPTSRGTRQGSVGDIQGPPLAELEAPQATQTIALMGNLWPNDTCRTFNPSHPDGPDSANASTHVRIFDERGSKHTLSFYFSPCASLSAGPNHYDLSYDVHVMEGNRWLGMAQLFFDAQGRLAQVNQDNLASIARAAGLGSQQVIALDVGDPVDMPGSSGRRGLTCYQRGIVPPHATSDGHAAGLLSQVEAIDDFVLVGKTAGGAARHLGTVVTATFSPDTPLVRVAPNVFKRRDDSPGDDSPGDDLRTLLQARDAGQPSTELTVAGNLPFGLSDAAFDPTRPENTCTTWTRTQIFGDQATPWDVTLYFAREVHAFNARGYPIRYQYIATVAPTDASQPPVSVGEGVLYFDRFGQLAQINGDGKARLDLSNTKAWASGVDLHFDAMTVYDAPARLRLQADGHAGGLLTALRIHASGEVEGEFSNFTTQSLVNKGDRLH